MPAFTNPNPLPPGIRSLDQYLDDLVQQLKLLPLTSKARGPLIARIRSVEAEIDSRETL